MTTKATEQHHTADASAVMAAQLRVKIDKRRGIESRPSIIALSKATPRRIKN